MSGPRVSILIPAYNERFFPEALGSALAQTYRDLEVVVCDDSPGNAIEAAARAAGDPRIRYLRNPARLGFAANFTQCFTLARGEFVKFLNDDDRLMPACVERLAQALATQPAVTLATSRRRVIDATGEVRRDTFATTPVSHVSAVFIGRELGDFALMNASNFIGEPTTVMFRRAGLALEDGALFRWGGRDYHCLADLSVWLRLLAGGLAYYAAAPLSEYRLHPGQEQRKEGVAIHCFTERLALARRARSLGFLAAPEQFHTALESLERHARAWLDGPGPSALDRVVVEQLLAEIAAGRRR